MPTLLSTRKQMPEDSAFAKATTFTKEQYESLWENHPLQGVQRWVTKVEGQIPEDIDGTLLINGPGMLTIGGTLVHIFDGHGLIRLVAIRNGKMYFRTKFVETKVLMEEVKADRVLYRGFGTLKPGGIRHNALDFKPRNVANTSVLHWNNALYANWEGGFPHKLDEKTLETVGMDDLNGVLKPKDTFTAHYRVDPDRNVLVAFGSPQPPSRVMKIYEFDTAMKLLSQKEYTLPIPTFIHDFCLTPNYYVFFLGPMTLSKRGLVKVIAGMSPFNEVASLDKKSESLIVAVPRPHCADPTVKEAKFDSAFGFHMSNAYEDGRKLVLDGCVATDYDLDFDFYRISKMPRTQVVRHIVDLDKLTVEKKVLEDIAVDFPTLHPQLEGKKYRHVAFVGPDRKSLVGSFPFQMLTKHDLETGQKTDWFCGIGRFLGEAIFVPRVGSTAEDDGYYIVPIFDCNTRTFKIAFFDAQHIEKGPIAEADTETLVPFQFHGHWSPKYLGPL